MKFAFVLIVILAGLFLLGLIGYTGQIGKMIRVDMSNPPKNLPLQTSSTSSGATTKKTTHSSSTKNTSSSATPLPPPPGFIGPTSDPFVVGPSGPPPQ